MKLTNLRGEELFTGDRVTVPLRFGGHAHGVIDHFGTRYAYVRLTATADHDSEGRVITIDPDVLRSGWHGQPTSRDDELRNALHEYVKHMLGFAVDDKIITVEQARVIISQLPEYGGRSRFDSPALSSGTLDPDEPPPVPARD